MHFNMLFAKSATFCLNEFSRYSAHFRNNVTMTLETIGISVLQNKTDELLNDTFNKGYLMYGYHFPVIQF